MSKYNRRGKEAVKPESLEKSRSDNSLFVSQRDKLKDNLSIRQAHKLNVVQQQIIDTALDKQTSVIIIDGVAGTGKTFCAVLASLLLLNSKSISELVFIRSLVQAKDGETGFLSGDLAEKTYYYNIPLFDKLNELLPKNDIDFLMKEKRILTYPTAMLRGYNFNASAVILDEGQNCHMDSISTVLTRMGRFSKLFILGDTTGQNDYGAKSGFKKCCEIFSDNESFDNGIKFFKLDETLIVRSPLTAFILKKLKNV
mgnify:CR=1 FL=1